MSSDAGNRDTLKRTRGDSESAARLAQQLGKDGAVGVGEVSHSITSSARASSDCGSVNPSALAVFRLMSSSYFVGSITGKSDGLDPFKIFPA